MGKDPETERMLIAPGIYVDVKSSIKKNYGKAPQGDTGYYEVTQDPDDRWKYRTSSLRNIALTAPYMHDGRFATLEEVVEHYNSGIQAHPTLSAALTDTNGDPVQLNFTDAEKSALVAFLKT